MERNYVCEFVGGIYHGITIPREEAVSKFKSNVTGYTEDLTAQRNKGAWVHRAELDNQPEFKGYLGPMYGGERNSTMILRYETQEVYDMLSR